MVGLALSAVIVTLMVDTLKVYLARVPGAVTSIPGGLRKKSAWGGFLGRLRLPFSKLSSLPSPRRRSILIRSLIGGVIMFIVGLVIVTGVEASVGKNLSCWAWDNCYTESSSADAGNASDASGLPSIFIAGNSISGSAPQVSPSVPQQQQAVAPTPPGSPSSSGTKAQPSGSEQPSAPPSEQQSSPSTEYQQQSEYSQQEEYQQQSLTSDSESERQSFSSSSETQLPSDSRQQSSTSSEGADEARWSW